MQLYLHWHSARAVPAVLEAPTLPASTASTWLYTGGLRAGTELDKVHAASAYASGKGEFAAATSSSRLTSELETVCPQLVLREGCHRAFAAGLHGRRQKTCVAVHRVLQPGALDPFLHVALVSDVSYPAHALRAQLPLLQ